MGVGGKGRSGGGWWGGWVGVVCVWVCVVGGGWGVYYLPFPVGFFPQPRGGAFGAEHGTHPLHAPADRAGDFAGG